MLRLPSGYLAPQSDVLCGTSPTRCGALRPGGSDRADAWENTRNERPVEAEWQFTTAVRLALLGQRPEDIAPQVFVTARQVRTWVTRYNAGGPDGLADAPGRGRKPPLDADQGKALAARLRAGPAAADGVCTLRGEDVRRILKDEFGVVRSLQAVYDLLPALGFEPLRPRPPGASAEAQAASKKTRPANVTG